MEIPRLSFLGEISGNFLFFPGSFNCPVAIFCVLVHKKPKLFPLYGNLATKVTPLPSTYCITQYIHSIFGKIFQF